MISTKARCDIDWKVLEDTPILAQRTIGPEVPTPTIPISYNTLVSHLSMRVVIQLDRFMYLGVSFETILKDHEMIP